MYTKGFSFHLRLAKQYKLETLYLVFFASRGVGCSVIKRTLRNELGIPTETNYTLHASALFIEVAFLSYR